MFQHYYKPVQLSVDKASCGISYTEQQPCELLKPLVHCFWELKTMHRLSDDFIYRVAADGCSDIFFEVENPELMELTGFTPNSALFSIGKEFHYCGIRFYPGAFTQLTKISANELNNTSEFLQQVHSSLYEALKPASENPEFFVELAQNALLKYCANIIFSGDSRMNNALHIILKQNGNIGLETDLQIGLSSRQLRRLFQHYIGVTPKTFTRVIRFQHLLGQLNSLSDLRRSALYFDNGYFDQPHFIREFKTFYGLTPSQASG